jgi:hypothetical protein
VAQGKPEDAPNPVAAEQKPPQIDASSARSGYANFFRVAVSAEEAILDFGLNPPPSGGDPEPAEISQRVVVNFYTLKRLLHVLHATVRQHEAAFGPLELDPRKRQTTPPPGEGG